MAQVTHEQYELLERAITAAQRIVVSRRGTEYILIPSRLGTRRGREFIEAQNPTTGDEMTIYLDEVGQLDVV